jgi:hypothetical protein
MIAQSRSPSHCDRKANAVLSSTSAFAASRPSAGFGVEGLSLPLVKDRVGQIETELSEDLLGQIDADGARCAQKSEDVNVGAGGEPACG